jgi:FkbM family methyltransferase
MKNLVRRTFQSLGFDIRLVRNLTSAKAHAWQQKQDAAWRSFVSHADIQTVVDVGANGGQFASLIHRQCPKASIISFEPLEACQEELQQTLVSIPGSRIIKAAVGEFPGTMKMNSSEFSPCSSLLQGTELLGEVYEKAARTTTIDVDVVTLDEALGNVTLKDNILVKLDVQGYEIPAIRGAVKLLSRTRMVVCEVSFFRRLYAGQPLFHDVYEELRLHGFTYMGNAEQSVRPTDGRFVEADAVFEKL